MSSPRFLRTLAPLLLVVSLAACGRSGSNVEPVQAGAGGASTTVVPTTGGPSTSQPTPAPTVGPSVASTTTAPAAGAEGRPDPSPVDGVTPAELRRVVEAPARVPTRALGGPVADQVVIDGQARWRVRIPGRFVVRDAIVRVLVGGKVVGVGIVSPDLGSLVAVTTDGDGLVAGARVAYRWDGSPAVSAGTLEVAR